MSNCFYCKGKLKKGLTNYMTEVEGQFFIIKDVPCEKCSQCGETVFSGETVKRLEEIIDTLKNKMTEVSIVKYAA